MVVTTIIYQALFLLKMYHLILAWVANNHLNKNHYDKNSIKPLIQSESRVQKTIKINSINLSDNNRNI